MLFLTLWNDLEEEGIWTHVDPSHPPPDIIWHLSEPNGEIGENCLQYTLIVVNAGTENEKISSLVGRDLTSMSAGNILFSTAISSIFSLHNTVILLDSRVVFAINFQMSH